MYDKDLVPLLVAVVSLIASIIAFIMPPNGHRNLRIVIGVGLLFVAIILGAWGTVLLVLNTPQTPIEEKLPTPEMIYTPTDTPLPPPQSATSTPVPPTDTPLPTNTPMATSTNTPIPISCPNAIVLGPWSPISGQGQNITLESGDGFIHADFWSPSAPLKEGFDEVSVIIEPGTTVTVIGVAGQAWQYSSTCTRESVEEQVAIHQQNRQNLGKRITTVTLDELPIQKSNNEVTICDASGSLPPLPGTPPNGCVLIVEWFVAAESTCGIVVTLGEPPVSNKAIGTWWYVYPNRPDTHLIEYQQKESEKDPKKDLKCIVQDLR